MRLNADFDERAAVKAEDAAWTASPEAGVERLMLDRIGDEVARATSLVRYAPGSRFSRHRHEKGEEFLVLRGVFSDETGDFPAGSYVRNPPGSAHAPASADGCTIFVKLRQFHDDDLQQFAVDTGDDALWDEDVLRLHVFGRERITMQNLADGATLPIDAEAGGTELLVIDGALGLEGETFPAWSWLRFPAGDAVTLTATAATRLWVKSGHLDSPGMTAQPGTERYIL